MENLINGLVGAIIGIFSGITVVLIKNIVFWCTVSRKLKGKYKVTEKGGELYRNGVIEWAKIESPFWSTVIKGKIIKFEMDFNDSSNMFGNSCGVIQFSFSDRYGKGFYNHTIRKEKYGFAELIILDENKLAFQRKFTTDSTHKNPNKIIETSFIWTKSNGKKEKL